MLELIIACNAAEKSLFFFSERWMMNEYYVFVFLNCSCGRISIAYSIFDLS